MSGGGGGGEMSGSGGIMDDGPAAPVVEAPVQPAPGSNILPEFRRIDRFHLSHNFIQQGSPIHSGEYVCINKILLQ